MEQFLSCTDATCSIEFSEAAIQGKGRYRVDKPHKRAKEELQKTKPAKRGWKDRVSAQGARARCPAALPAILLQLSGDLRDAPLKHCCVFHTESHSNVMTQPPKKHFNKPRSTEAGIVCHPAGTNALATEPERTHIRVGDTRTTSVYQTQQVYQ